MTGLSPLDTTCDQAGEINFHALRLAGTRSAGLKHLFHGVGKAVGVLDHQAIKIAALGIVNLPPLQRLQVETDGSNGRFQFVGYRVDEAIVLLVLANFAQQKAGIEDEPGHNGPEKDCPEEQLCSLAPIHNDPAETDGHRHGGKHNSKGEKKDEFAAPRYAHIRILTRQIE